MKKIKVISLTVTILIMALIFFFSSQTGDESAEISDGLIMKIAMLIRPDISEAEQLAYVKQFSHLVRKAAHFTIYAALGLSVATTVKSHFKITNRNALWTATSICVAYAVSDEIHQFFVSERSMKITDILIDSAGALTGICLFFILYKCFWKHIFEMKGGVDFDN